MHRKFHAIELDSCQRDNGSDRIAWKLNLNKYETRSNGLAKWQRGSTSDRKNTDLITKKSLSQRLSCKAIPPNFQTLTSGAIYTSSLSIMAAYYRQEIQAPSWPNKNTPRKPRKCPKAGHRVLLFVDRSGRQTRRKLSLKVNTMVNYTHARNITVCPSVII